MRPFFRSLQKDFWHFRARPSAHANIRAARRGGDAERAERQERNARGDRGEREREREGQTIKREREERGAGR